MEIVEYLDERGRSPFGYWFDGLDVRSAARVAAYVARLAHGGLATAKGLGGGVSELRIDSGPGYRIYFGRDGETLVILLAGGTKRRQQKDIAAARERWADYRRRKGMTA